MMCNIARSLAGGGGVVIGSYTGNDATSGDGVHPTRDISLDITPSAIILFRLSGDSRSTTAGTPVIMNGDTYSYNGAQAKLNGNTLTVGGYKTIDGYIGFNKNGVKYNYIAFT